VYGVAAAPALVRLSVDVSVSIRVVVAVDTRRIALLTSSDAAPCRASNALFRFRSIYVARMRGGGGGGGQANSPACHPSCCDHRPWQAGPGGRATPWPSSTTSSSSKDVPRNSV